MRLTLRIAIAAILAARAAAPATGAETPTRTIARPQTAPDGARAQAASERIQLGSWSSAGLGVSNDPLTEIVEIKDVKSGRTSGTGTFLRDCRVLTTLRVLLSIEHGKPTARLGPDESLIGKPYAFDTRPVPPSNTKTRGRLVVIAHGDLQGIDEATDALNDWALGYDDGCLSEKLKLGFVSLASATSSLAMSSLKADISFTAGHSQLAAARRGGQPELYVDSDCEPEREINGADHLFSTNCSVGEGGAGQLLLGARTRSGKPVIGLNGRVEKWAYGMFLAPTSVATRAPNVTQAMSLLLFGIGSVDLQRRQYLLGAVDVSRVQSRPTAFCSNLVAIGRETQERVGPPSAPASGGQPAVPTPRVSLAAAAGGLPAPTVCGVNESSIDRYSSRLSCAWLDRSEVELRSAFEATVGAVQACYPAFIETKRDAQVNTLDLTIPSGVPGGNTWLNVRADEHGMSIAVTRAEAMRARSRRTYVPKDFCDSLEAFSATGSPGGGRGAPRASLPGATTCSTTLSPSRNSCVWSNRPAQEAKREFEVMASSMQACFPTGRAFEVHEPGRLRLDLFVPAESPGGGSSRFALRLERGEISLAVSRERR